MDYFNYKDGELHAEEVAISELATHVGTPFYCYSSQTLARHYRVLANSLEGCDFRICFAVKSNSNIAVLASLGRLGAGADVVSAGEIRRALAAGISADSIVFSGVGKTRDEMAFALDHGIFQFNVESQAELHILNEIALSKSQIAPVAIRINPDVDAITHAKISTGKKDDKFGVPIQQALELYAQSQQLQGIRFQGISMHIGSQLTQLAPFRQAYSHAAEFVKTLRAGGHIISVIDAGGGLGIPYCEESEPPLPHDYGAVVKEIFAPLGAKIILEPGRLIVGNAGILVSRVIYSKYSHERRFIIVDAAMNDLMRPSLYDAYHAIVPVSEAHNATPLTPADVVGPVCESSDIFAKDRLLPDFKPDDLIAFRSAGAYGAVMSGTYNTRLLIPEVLVNGAQWSVVRARPTYEELLKCESIPGWV